MVEFFLTFKKKDSLDKENHRPYMPKVYEGLMYKQIHLPKAFDSINHT